jgi:RNA polymerase sigma factor (sigma-70 family)
MTERPGESEVIANLLQRFNSADAGAAWAQFMDRYSPLIMSAVRQFEYEHDRRNDCFLHVCEKLVERDFRRLLSFNTRGDARFTTWLGTVVFNLCVDWHRQEYGRAQLLTVITALPAFDQEVYRLRFEQGLSIDSCFETLAADFPDLTRRQLSDAMARVHRVLTPRQRWQISVRHRRRQRDAAAPEPESLRHLDRSPEEEAQAQIEARRVHAALQAMPAEQRLLLLLRFQQGLTLKRIAAILELGDPFRTRRRVQAALDTLSAEIARLERRARK